MDLHDDVLPLVLLHLDLKSLQHCKASCRRLLVAARLLIASDDWRSAKVDGFESNRHDFRVALWRANVSVCTQLTGGKRTRVMLLLDANAPPHSVLSFQLRGLGARPMYQRAPGGEATTTNWYIMLVGPTGWETELERHDPVLAPFEPWLREPLLELVIDLSAVPRPPP